MEESMDLGESLRQAREEKKLTVEEVSNELNLKKLYIEAMESDTILNFLPVPYARGFLRSYATMLGLDYHIIVDKFDALHTSEIPKLYTKTVGNFVSLEYRPHRSRKMFSILIIVLVVVAVSAAIFFFKTYFRGQPVGSLIGPIKDEETTGKVDTGGEQNSENNTIDEGVRLVLEVRFIKNARISLTTDGENIPGKFYTSGTIEEFSARKNLGLVIDEAADVEVLFDGKKLPNLGEGKTRVTLDESNRTGPIVEQIGPTPTDD